MIEIHHAKFEKHLKGSYSNFGSVLVNHTTGYIHLPIDSLLKESMTFAIRFSTKIEPLTRSRSINIFHTYHNIKVRSSLRKLLSLPLHLIIMSQLFVVSRHIRQRLPKRYLLLWPTTTGCNER